MSLYFGNRQVALNLGDAIRDTILPEPTAANAGRIVKVGEEGGYILDVENDSSALLNSPNFTGTPTVPDLTSDSVGTQIANKNYVDNHTPDLSGYMQKGVDYITAGKKVGTTLGINATAEGMGTTATGQFAHAEGNGTVSSARSAHAEGTNTSASGLGAHAEGIQTAASGDYSHAEGMYTAARYRSQHTFGEYNVFDIINGTLSGNRGTYVEIVGNGTSTSARSNARTLDWSGNEVLAGKLTVGAGPTNNMDVATKQYVDTTLGTVDALPSQTGNSGKFLTTDGTAASWANVDALPSQSGQSGKFLTTNGTIASWATKPTYTAAEVGALDNAYFGYLDANANILYLPKNWSYSQSASDYSYWFSFIARDNYNTDNIKSGLKLRIFGSSSNLFTIEGFSYEGENKTLPFSLSPGVYLARFNDGFLDVYRVTTKSDIPTYTLSMSGNRITLTPSSGTASYIDLPVYNGSVVY